MELLTLLFLFSLLCVPFSWLLPEKWQVTSISFITLSFLSLHAPISLAILLGTVLVNYYILHNYSNKATTSLIVIGQISFIFLLFKMDWPTDWVFTDSFKLIPLGLSYYSFRQIHYALDHYKGTLPKHELKDFLNYLFFLPTILIGPINRFQNFHRDQKRRRWDSTLFSLGLERMLYGFAKVYFLGNYIFTIRIPLELDKLITPHPILHYYLDHVNFFLNTYIQFAGYSDIAIGLALLLGFRVMENFNFPLLATNISEFWNRYHISLSSWCRDYVYYPIVGIWRNPFLAVVGTMLVIALWHEISLQYILWGTFHGLGIAVWHRYDRSNLAKLLRRYKLGHPIIASLLTFHFVVLSFTLIKEDSLQNAWQILNQLF